MVGGCSLWSLGRGLGGREGGGGRVDGGRCWVVADEIAVKKERDALGVWVGYPDE